jgi:hypothetical protein
MLAYDGANQFRRGYALSALLSAFPIRPQMFPPLHRLRERVFKNVSQWSNLQLHDSKVDLGAILKSGMMPASESEGPRIHSVL